MKRISQKTKEAHAKRRAKKLRAAQHVSCHSNSPPEEVGLTQQFLDSVNWRPPAKNRQKTDSSKDNVLTMMRAPERKLAHGLDNRFVARSIKAYSGPAAEVETATYQRYWDARLENVRPLTGAVDFLRSGAVVWKHMGLKASPARVARMIGVAEVNAAMAEAVEIAMFNAFNTSAVVPDLENIAFAFGSYFYNRPEGVVPLQGDFYLPFGGDTAYTLLKPHSFGAE